ncbi:MAG TPA: DUF302 domain-containing protein [Alphaproteobacteria bacterium]|nr:DUF302 domain-containing protein [Alphaproteobacteria bacterium]
MNIAGLVALPSSHSVKDTLDRLEAALKSKGIQVFARIDHGAGAAAVGMSLRPTELLVFGHPKGGTPLMEARQTVGIDLPLKALAWQDEAGKVWLAYNDMHWLATRHNLGAEAAAAVDALAQALAELAREAAG